MGTTRSIHNFVDNRNHTHNNRNIGIRILK